jgi:phospholipase/carboxylesterase
MSEQTFRGPHQGQPVLRAGAPLERAKAAMIMVHGRGATAESILTLAPEFDQPEFAYLAPQAAGNTWYPYSFMSPIPNNEPGISSGMAALAAVLAAVQAAGIPAERTILLGFSQGACLATEFGARNARRYGGLIALSGGLIGPDGTPRDYAGSLDGTPVFMGCSDEVLRMLGGAVDVRLYPGMGHTVNQDEIDAVRAIMAKQV